MIMEAAVVVVDILQYDEKKKGEESRSYCFHYKI